MIAVLGGLGAAFAFGISTLAYSRAARLLGPFVVLGWVMLVGIAIVAPAVVLIGFPVTFTGDVNQSVDEGRAALRGDRSHLAMGELNDGRAVKNSITTSATFKP